MSDKNDPNLVRPDARSVLTSPVHLIAFGFGSGLAPKAPGTFGTLVGVAFWYALRGLPTGVFCGLLLALFILGCGVCGRSARMLGVHDYGGIVFDEVVGYLVAALPLLPALGWVRDADVIGPVVAFVLFRLFDIAKPWPIRVLDRRVGGGFGIMVDDVLAGVFAAVSLLVLHAILRAYAVT